MNIIQLSNFRLWNAVTLFRINPSAETKCEVRDALNQRRSMRERFHAPIPREVMDECARQIKAFGRVEDFQAVLNANPHRKPQNNEN